MDLNKYDLIKYGYFSDVLPLKSFSTAQIADFLKENSFVKCIENLYNNKIYSTPCIVISSYKNDLERRMIQVPHIQTYVLLCHEIEKLNPVIKKKINLSSISQSKQINPFGFEAYSILPSFIDAHNERIIKSMGYNYLLELDISKCYENIYTHSISWAYLGKENAKKELSKGEKSNDYKLMDNLDKRLRALNNNETKGILTGPITSRIISEFILSSIDEIIQKSNINCTRYVDDYKFFFKSKQEAENFIPKFQNILYEYKLNINTEKTKITKYPYESGYNLRFELGNFDIKKHGAVSFINKCNELFLSGNKGAYKYGLKILNNTKIEKDERVVVSQLINIMSINPMLSDLIIGVFKFSNIILNDDCGKIVNDILELSIEKSLEVEIAWLLYLSLIYGFKIRDKIIIDILEKTEVFSTILILDYINKNNLEKKFEGNFKNLEDKIIDESIFDDKWLLIYQAKLFNWIKSINHKKIYESELIKIFFDNKLSFYFSPQKIFD